MHTHRINKTELKHCSKDRMPQAPLYPTDAHLNQLVEGLIDEDEGYEEGKDLLGESGDKANQEASLQSHHEQGQEHQPEANPHSAHQVLQLVATAELSRKGGESLGVTGTMSRKGSGVGQKALTEKKASSKTKRGPEKPITSNG